MKRLILKHWWWIYLLVLVYTFGNCFGYLKDANEPHRGSIAVTSFFSALLWPMYWSARAQEKS